MIKFQTDERQSEKDGGGGDIRKIAKLRQIGKVGKIGETIKYGRTRAVHKHNGNAQNTLHPTHFCI